ncbi:MAG TPA: hypothetical protein VHK24_00100, partial [Steroidobacter sp.]|nr:hypothetical protein [Steroidobacter sp.]
AQYHRKPRKELLRFGPAFEDLLHRARILREPTADSHEGSGIEPESAMWSRQSGIVRLQWTLGPAGCRPQTPLTY